MGLGLKNFFGLDRNETVWSVYKFRNDPENFGLVWNEYQSETFARVLAFYIYFLTGLFFRIFQGLRI